MIRDHSTVVADTEPRCFRVLIDISATYKVSFAEVTDGTH
jgi:hypothetical protein